MIVSKSNLVVSQGGRLMYYNYKQIQKILLYLCKALVAEIKAYLMLNADRKAHLSIYQSVIALLYQLHGTNRQTHPMHEICVFFSVKAQSLFGLFDLQSKLSNTERRKLALKLQRCLNKIFDTDQLKKINHAELRTILRDYRQTMDANPEYTSGNIRQMMQRLYLECSTKYPSKWQKFTAGLFCCDIAIESPRLNSRYSELYLWHKQKLMDFLLIQRAPVRQRMIKIIQQQIDISETHSAAGTRAALTR